MTEEERKYIDAKNDILKALKSINELTPLQRQQLAQELFRVDAFLSAYNAVQHYFCLLYTSHHRRPPEAGMPASGDSAQPNGLRRSGARPRCV